MLNIAINRIDVKTVNIIVHILCYKLSESYKLKLILDFVENALSGRRYHEHSF